ncbi:hypothetical protein, partial [Burkholderia vietnamiensis]
NRCTTLSRGGSDLDENGGSRFGENQHIAALSGPKVAVQTVFAWLMVDGFNRSQSREDAEYYQIGSV